MTFSIWNGDINYCYPRLHRCRYSWFIMWISIRRQLFCRFLYVTFLERHLILVIISIEFDIDENLYLNKLRGFFFGDRFSLLYLHGNAGRVLYKCDKYFGRNQWTRGWPVANHCCFDYSFQFCGNYSRRTQSDRTWVFIVHNDALFCHFTRIMDVQSVRNHCFIN